MQITIVAVMCLSGAVQSACREEVVVKQDMAMQACVLSQPALAEWKEATIFRGDRWTISRIKCIPGSYSPKGAI